MYQISDEDLWGVETSRDQISELLAETKEFLKGAVRKANHGTGNFIQASAWNTGKRLTLFVTAENSRGGYASNSRSILWDQLLQARMPMTFVAEAWDTLLKDVLTPQAPGRQIYTLPPAQSS